MPLERIDLIYCHRPDPHTPIAETVWAMSDLVTQGKALYWGTSEWSAEDNRSAWETAECHRLHKPPMEQPQYHGGVPAGSRGAMESMAFLRDGLTDRAKNAAVAQREPIASELGGSVAQLALAWVAKNPRVSTVARGASRLEQLQANLGAQALLDKLSPECMARIDAVTSTLPD